MAAAAVTLASALYWYYPEVRQAAARYHHAVEPRLDHIRERWSRLCQRCSRGWLQLLLLGWLPTLVTVVTLVQVQVVTVVTLVQTRLPVLVTSLKTGADAAHAHVTAVAASFQLKAVATVTGMQTQAAAVLTSVQTRAVLAAAVFTQVQSHTFSVVSRTRTKVAAAVTRLRRRRWNVPRTRSRGLQTDVEVVYEYWQGPPLLQVQVRTVHSLVRIHTRG